MKPNPSILRETSRPVALEPVQFRPSADFDVEDAPSDLLGYWRAVMMRKWLILGIGLLAAFVATVVVHLMTPTFLSTATVLIETTSAKIVSVDEVYTNVRADREYVQTQTEVFKSRDVLLRAVQRTKLFDHPEFDPRQQVQPFWKVWIREYLPGGARIFPPDPVFDQQLLEDAVMLVFMDHLSIEPIKNTQLVKIHFEANDRTLAAAVANAVAEAFIQTDIESRMKLTQVAGEWLNERIDDVRAKLDTSEKMLQGFREREGLLDSKSTEFGGTVKQLDGLTQQLVEARVRRSVAEESYNQVRVANPESSPAVQRSPGVQRARQIEEEADRKLAELSNRFGVGHPSYVTAEIDLKLARENLQRQVQNAIAGVNREYLAARAVEKNLEGALAQAKNTIQGMNRKEIEVASLEREAATNRQIYEAFLSRQKETAATLDSAQPSARFVSRAVPSLLPNSPAKARIIAIALAAGLLLAAAGAVAAYQLDDSIRTSDDVEAKLRQPFLTALPLLTGKAKENPARAVLDYPDEIYTEAVYTAATGILLSAIDTPEKVIAVTSSVPGEGKSTFSINLAQSQAGEQRVLLIDADLRRPSISASMDLRPGANGLVELLTGTCKLPDVLQKGENGLHVIPSGRIPAKPLELLRSKRFQRLLAGLHASYDLIVIDCPPVQLVSDALIIGRLSTSLIYVVKANDTRTRLARAGLKRIEAAGIPVLGVVLNQQDLERAERYYGDSQGAGKYGYGKYGYSARADA